MTYKTQLTVLTILAMLFMNGCAQRGQGGNTGMPQAGQKGPMTQTKVENLDDMKTLFDVEDEEEAKEKAEASTEAAGGAGAGAGGANIPTLLGGGYFFDPLSDFPSLQRELRLLLAGQTRILRGTGQPGTPPRLIVAPEDDPIVVTAPVGLYAPMIRFSIFNVGGTDVVLEPIEFPEEPFSLSWDDCPGNYCQGGIIFHPKKVGKHEGRYVLRYRVPGTSTSNTITIRLQGTGYFRKVAMTPGEGGGPHLKILEQGFPNQSKVSSKFIGDPNSRGGLGTTAIGDVTGDYVPDILVGSGIGTASSVTVLDGYTLETVGTPISVFGGAVGGGVRVAVGEVNGDKHLDIVVATGKGTPARIQVIDGKTRRTLADFRPFDGAPVGAYVTLADVNGDFRAEVLIGPGDGGGPILSVYEVRTQSVLYTGYVGDSSNRSGLALAATYVDGDLTPDILYSYGNGTAFLGSFSYHQNRGLHVRDEFVPFEGFRGLIHVGSAFVGTEDLSPDLIFAAGPGGAPRVSALNWFLRQFYFDAWVFDENLRGGAYATGF